MALKLIDKKKVSLEILAYAKIIETVLIRELEILVAELQNHAKLSGEYDDQTINLRGSIGGVVLKDGKPISYAGFNSNGTDGNKVGLEFINSLIGDYQKGFVIILVAGMEYGTYVEDYHGLNVLKKSELKMQRELPVIIARIKAKIRVS